MQPEAGFFSGCNFCMGKTKFEGKKVEEVRTDLGVCPSPAKWDLLKAHFGRNGLRRGEAKRLAVAKHENLRCFW